MAKNQHVWIEVPPDEEIEGAACAACGTGKASERQSFFRMLVEPILASNHFGRPQTGRAAIHIEEAFEEAGATDDVREPVFVKLRKDPDGDLLKKAAENPEFGDPRRPGSYRPNVLRQFLKLGWIDRITDPHTEDPREKDAQDGPKEVREAS